MTLGMTPLIVAASEGETEIIMCLLALGADPDVRDFVSTEFCDFCQFPLLPIICFINGNSDLHYFALSV